MRSFQWRQLPVSLLSLAALAACGTGEEKGTSTLTLALSASDATAPATTLGGTGGQTSVGETASISTAFVTIDRIYLVTGECADQEAARRPQVGAPAEADLAEAAANDARCRVTLRDQPVTQDLRQLASATATLVSD
ncbi:MAG TPA: hypothetical protein VGJ84_08750, partial [Polyangiaceae bacterium]